MRLPFERVCVSFCRTKENAMAPKAMRFANNTAICDAEDQAQATFACVLCKRGALCGRNRCAPLKEPRRMIPRAASCRFYHRRISSPSRSVDRPGAAAEPCARRWRTAPIGNSSALRRPRRHRTHAVPAPLRNRSSAVRMPLQTPRARRSSAIRMPFSFRRGTAETPPRYRFSIRRFARPSHDRRLTSTVRGSSSSACSNARAKSRSNRGRSSGLGSSAFFIRGGST